MMLNEGTKVSGEYHGVAFSGVIRERRPHSCNYDIIYFVMLDAPVTVYGEARDMLCVTVDPETHCSRYGDRIAA